MTIEVAAARAFDDVRAVIGPKRDDATVCWCLSYRIPSKENLALRGQERGERVKELLGEPLAPGVLAYDADTPVGWAGVHPRRATHFETFRKIPHLEGPEPWSVWCFRVRPGHRRKGVMHALLDGAVAFARENGALAIEGYPVDTGGQRIDLTMGYVGTRSLFEAHGFTKAADTASMLSGFPRVLMRRDL